MTSLRGVRQTTSPRLLVGVGLTDSNAGLGG